MVFRAAEPGARMEANTSRALLLAGVGRAVKHAEDYAVSPMHAAKDKLIALIVNILAAYSRIRAVSEQLPQADRWKTFRDYVVAKITRTPPSWHPPQRLALVG